MRCRPGIVRSIGAFWRSRLSEAPLRKGYALHRSRDTFSTPAAGNDGAARLIGAEVVDPFDRQQLGEFDTCPIDAALHRADRAATDFRGFLVGEARRADQDQRFALVCWQLGQRLLEFFELDPAVLFGVVFKVSAKRPSLSSPRVGACDTRSGIDCAGW